LLFLAELKGLQIFKQVFEYFFIPARPFIRPGIVMAVV
jgi:hypothetical protein